MSRSWDPFGPTITDETITALVISAETRSGGKAVNAKRAEKEWAPLDIFEVDVLGAEEEDGTVTQGKVDETFQGKLSSTEIRRMQVRDLEAEATFNMPQLGVLCVQCLYDQHDLSG